MPKLLLCLRFSRRCILFPIFLLLFVMVLLVPYLDPQTTSRQQQLLVIDPVFYSHQKKAVSPDSLSQKISPDHPSSHSNLWIDLDPEKMTIIIQALPMKPIQHNLVCSKIYAS
uniref:Uncharacterized protein n=1 Tax=Amphimedon queenslandica TaxID=400682 RepID=A0A1X7SLE8_AMPQE